MTYRESAPYIGKKDLIGGLVMRTLMLFKVDAFLSHLATRKKVTKEAGSGFYEDKGGIFVPGRLFKDLTDRPTETTNWVDKVDTTTWKDFQEIEPIWDAFSNPMSVICNATTNYDGATLLFADGASYGHGLRLDERAMRAFKHMMASIYPTKYDRPITQDDLLGFYTLPDEHSNRYEDGSLVVDFRKVGERIKASVYAGFLLGHPSNFRQALDHEEQIERKSIILNADKEPQKDTLIAKPYVYCYGKTGMPDNPVGIIKVLGWGELGNFATSYPTDRLPTRLAEKRRTPHIFTYQHPNSSPKPVYFLLDRYSPTVDIGGCTRTQTWILSPNDIGIEYLRPIFKHGIKRPGLEGVVFQPNF